MKNDSNNDNGDQVHNIDNESIGKVYNFRERNKSNCNSNSNSNSRKIKSDSNNHINMKSDINSNSDYYNGNHN